MGDAAVNEWGNLVKPIVRKCRLAVMLHMNASFNEDGASALADLLEKMAEKLDDHIHSLEQKSEG